MEAPFKEALYTKTLLMFQPSPPPPALLCYTSLCPTSHVVFRYNQLTCVPVWSNPKLLRTQPHQENVPCVVSGPTHLGITCRCGLALVRENVARSLCTPPGNGSWPAVLQAVDMCDALPLLLLLYSPQSIEGRRGKARHTTLPRPSAYGDRIRSKCIWSGHPYRFS